MFRYITAIGFICLSAGSFAANPAPDGNTFENTSVNQALADYLNQRASWGSGLSQAAHQDSASALEQYLARRASWGSAPSRSVAADDDGTARALQAYLARRDRWQARQFAEIEQANQAALAAYLARRASWGTAPGVTSTAQIDTRPALAAYLAQRETWNRSRELAADAERNAQALTAYLARRDSWNAAAAADKNRQALAAYLARRDSWGNTPHMASNAGQQSDQQIRTALNEYLAQRDRFGARPALARIPDATITAALDRHLQQRAAWGTHPVISSADAQSARAAVVAGYLDRWAGTTRVAAVSDAATRSDAVSCADALRQLSSSSSIQFASGSAKLTAQSSGALKRLAATARGCEGFRIRIEGHTDSTGDAARNQALSEARAAAVANYLEAAGLSGGMMQAIGMGASQPVAPNTTSANRAQNRRIELSVLVN